MKIILSLFLLLSSPFIYSSDRLLGSRRDYSTSSEVKEAQLKLEKEIKNYRKWKEEAQTILNDCFPEILLDFMQFITLPQAPKTEAQEFHEICKTTEAEATQKIENLRQVFIAAKRKHKNGKLYNGGQKPRRQSHRALTFTTFQAMQEADQIISLRPDAASARNNDNNTISNNNKEGQ